jgi:hypothetical protein
MRDADHRFKSFFHQRPLKLLKSIVIRIKWIVPVGGIIIFIDDFENPIILSRTVDFYFDCLAVSQYLLAVL